MPAFGQGGQKQQRNGWSRHLPFHQQESEGFLSSFGISSIIHELHHKERSVRKQVLWQNTPPQGRNARYYLCWPAQVSYNCTAAQLKKNLCRLCSQGYSSPHCQMEDANGLQLERHPDAFLNQSWTRHMHPESPTTTSVCSSISAKKKKKYWYANPFGV